MLKNLTCILKILKLYIYIYIYIYRIKKITIKKKIEFVACFGEICNLDRIIYSSLLTKVDKKYLNH